MLIKKINKQSGQFPDPVFSSFLPHIHATHEIYLLTLDMCPTTAVDWELLQNYINLTKIAIY